ncbi:MAG: filamentous hemagglutinin N-terminal domain-containing protein [Leptolyngbyaceae cyanobacterium bins.302]|nr:filamentous hemagglutinin N-terminal domain-containing protein [Leptolyngbyaceae cyanobacterium bins.302]
MAEQRVDGWVRSIFVGVLGGIGAIAVSAPAFSQSLIVPDATLGAESSIVVENFSGLPVEAIVGGAQRGANLFHSFREFNVASGRGAYFFSPNAAIQNILARVTGTNRTEILGTLGTFGNSQPNLFLINPNGIIFGQNASLALRGSFYGTTASGIKFGDNGEFSAVNPQPPSNLLTINPTAFFFTSQTPGAIINQSQADQTVLGDPTFGLQVPDSQTLLLLGGDVLIDRGILNAWGGRIEIGSVATEGNMVLNPNGSLEIPNGLQRGDVTITNSALIDVQLSDKGDIGITANNINILNGSRLLAGIFQGLGTSNSQAGDVTLNATGLVQAAGPSSGIANNVAQNSNGDGGNLRITANALEVRDDVRLLAVTFGNGNAGNVIIEARDRVLFSDFVIASSRIDLGGQGKGGNVQITTKSLEVLNNSQLVASTLGSGDAGDVIISARDRVLFSDSAAFSTVGDFNPVINAVRVPQGKGGNIQIDSNSLEVLNGSQLLAVTFGNGDAGNVLISARDRVLFSGVSRDGQVPSGALSDVSIGAVGRGGNVQINSNSLEVLNGAKLSTSTVGIGDAGNVIVEARDHVIFSGTSADGRFISSAFSSVESGGIGRGGDIRINSNSLKVLNGAGLSAATGGIGDAGNVLITARDRILFSGTSADGQFSSAAFSNVGETGVGKGGNVQITSNTLEVLNGSQLLADTRGTGDAGNILLTVRDLALFDGGAVLSSVATGAVGRGGNVQITSNTLEVLNGSQMIASTSGRGNAGNVLITADVIALDGSTPNGQFGSAIFSTVRSTGIGQGGNINLVTRILSLTGGTEISASTFGAGDAGNVLVTADVIALDGSTPDDQLGSGIFSTVGSTGIGQGGNINLDTRFLNLTNRATISASTGAQGNAGDIFISAHEGIFIVESGILTEGISSSLAGDITITAPLIFMDRGLISAESTAVDGGNINLNMGQLLLMRNGSQISTTAGTAQAGGNGGNITINAPEGFIIGVKSENSDITANAFSGSGGRVNITAQGIFGLQFRPRLTQFSDITASSTFGVNGIVTLNTPNVDPSRGLAQLPQNLIDTNRILANSCLVRDGAAGGTFIITGTGGLPVRPGDAVLPVFETGEVRGLAADDRTNETDKIPAPSVSSVTNPLPTHSLVEAQGIYRLPDGQIILSWECAK